MQEVTGKKVMLRWLLYKWGDTLTLTQHTENNNNNNNNTPKTKLKQNNTKPTNPTERQKDLSIITLNTNWINWTIEGTKSQTSKLY